MAAHVLGKVGIWELAQARKHPVVDDYDSVETISRGNARACLKGPSVLQLRKSIACSQICVLLHFPRGLYLLEELKSLRSEAVTIAEFIYTVLLKPKFMKSAANSMIRMLLPKSVRYGPVWVVLNRKDPVVSGALMLHVYERSEMIFVERSVRQAMTVVDVGANVGLYSALAGHLVGPEGLVIAFEPDPECFYYLNETIQKNRLKNVKTVCMAASDRQGRSRLFTSTANRGDSRLYDNELSDGSVEVQTVILDEYLAATGIRELDFLKIDVQGFEGQVFAGLESTMLRSPQLVVMSEFWPEGLRRAGTDPEELLKRLERLGLTIHELLGDGTTQPIVDKRAFIDRWKGRQYTNIVCRKSNSE